VLVRFTEANAYLDTHPIIGEDGTPSAVMAKIYGNLVNTARLNILALGLPVPASKPLDLADYLELRSSSPEATEGLPVTHNDAQRDERNTTQGSGHVADSAGTGEAEAEE